MIAALKNVPMRRGFFFISLLKFLLGQLVYFHWVLLCSSILYVVNGRSFLIVFHSVDYVWVVKIRISIELFYI